ncbi:type I glutamate--ammonia ligase [Rickettsiales endosymbiont of Stachyamoeba lipophora]|uniref:type I glutamate--ammonia ligase n=1 Tax=Rickettsiales endosymbiont of Stachyamoeba lipophora TaxID=2486578 RepID=UPI000F64CDD6|nr:type I glutamate--ammonia ligase [Rickettsiales endosymbiont of Stachyamoeba lipophora]AZL15287.1 type I glutamate--ammonia ligase [Rickettsiales endosymbiont of Stachyamoeba lipophora]
MADLNHIKELVKEYEIEIVDFRFTDIFGKWHHFSYEVETAMELINTHGGAFDGCSLPGWRAINNSDMLTKPDLSTAFVDPFTAQPTLNIICTVEIPGENKGYDRDPRSIAKRAIDYLHKTGLADQAYFGPEPEFFIFDDVRFKASKHESYYHLNSTELSINNGIKNEAGNNGYKCKPKSGYLTSQPFDHGNDLRSEMLTTMKSVGIKATLHHHEVSSAQSEVGFAHDDLVRSADNLQKFKYVAHNIALSYGKSITFMPKPLIYENGSGMHVHQSLWKDGKNLFAGNKYAGLSDLALYYIGGIIKHGKSINAFTNPTTNSYKRLVPGYEAPVALAYSACNRSAGIRIPYSNNEKARRIEARFPDPSANPYLLTTVLLMAGLDGIINKIHPGEATEQNLYELSQEELNKIDSLSHSLDEALDSLEQDHDYLLKGGVFSKEFIQTYIKLKRQEADLLKIHPHPLEFEMYY